MNLFIFSSSTGFISLPEGESYIEMLEKTHNPQGIWINGLSVLATLYYVRQFIKGNKRTVILHLGSVECFSRPVEQFIITGIKEMGIWWNNPAWKEYYYYKLIKAATYLEKKENRYIRPLENFEFKKLYEDLLVLLEGCKIIVMGMSKPAKSEPHWYEQASDFDKILHELSFKYNTIFIDIWNKYEKYVVDSNHLNSEGHKLLLEEVKCLL